MAISIPEKVVEKLKDNLLKVDKNESHDLLYIERAIGICSSALLELREWVNQFNFTDKSDEIHFFKVTKPYVISEYLYYFKLFEIESRQPVTSIKARNEDFVFAAIVGVMISIIIIITEIVFYLPMFIRFKFHFDHQNRSNQILIRQNQTTKYKNNL